MELDIQRLLERTTLTIPFADFLPIVQESYPEIGHITSVAPILEGYEDANFVLECDKGKYVLKIFLHERSEGNIHDYVKVIQEATKAGVQTLELVHGASGYLHRYEDTYFILTHFFPGKNFDHVTPTVDDMCAVATSLARLNTLTFTVTPTYDSWGNANTVAEYDKHKDELSDEQRTFLHPTIEALRTFSTQGFSTSVIHGDLQRKHVLNDGKRLCLLDYGCLRNDCKVYDLATFLAWFCLGKDTITTVSQWLKPVIDTYQAVHHLTPAELASLPLLIQASYASFSLQSSLLIKEGDTSPQTHDWNTQAKLLLEEVRKLSL